MARNSSGTHDAVVNFACALWIVGLVLWVGLTYWPVNDSGRYDDESVRFQDVQQQIMSLQRDVALLHEMVKAYKMQHGG
jgi:predicted negative regulator of RcsB-dependent stress response